MKHYPKLDMNRLTKRQARDYLELRRVRNKFWVWFFVIYFPLWDWLNFNPSHDGSRFTLQWLLVFFTEPLIAQFFVLPFIILYNGVGFIHGDMRFSTEDTQSYIPLWVWIIVKCSAICILFWFAWAIFIKL